MSHAPGFTEPQLTGPGLDLGTPAVAEYFGMLIIKPSCGGAGGSHAPLAGMCPPTGAWRTVMSYTGSGNTGGGWQGSTGPSDYEHAFDPYLQPDLFRGVLTRRVIAFIIDLFIISVPVVLAVLFIAVFGLV